MSTREIADLLFTPFQEDAHESMDPPWAIPDPLEDCCSSSAFNTNRVGDPPLEERMFIEHEPSGKKFLVLIRELQ